jgi:hypothetical protein
MDALYTVHSHGHPSTYPDGQVEEDGSVALEWFCVDRAQPIAPYTSLIRGYTMLEEPYRSNAQCYMDELFTREEVQLLLPYLCFTYGTLVGIRVIPIPMDIWVAAGQSMANPTSVLLAHEAWIIAHTLSPEEGYPLPFKVCAYYRRNI